MKRLLIFLKSFSKSNSSTQQDVINFMNNEDTLRDAAEGSMQKRIDLIERVKVTHKSI